MTARHERFMMRRNPLVMTLLEPLRLSFSITQRRENFALSLFPRIRISVGAILQQLGREEFHSLFQNTSNSYPVRMLRDGHTPVSLKFAAYSSHKNELTENTHNHTSNTRSENLSFTEQKYLPRQFFQSPVARLFERLQREHHGVVLLKSLLVQHDSGSTVERVVREHSRVEQRTRSDLVIRQQNVPATAAAKEQQSLTLEKQIMSTRTHTHSWPEKPPEINVDQLTEQVIRKLDHRITAYRERLGRAF
jgi:hypothetical protein